MEVLGSAAAIIQLAGVGLALAKTLYSICNEGASTSEQVKELCSHVENTSRVLEEIGKVFEEESRATKLLISSNAITTANDVMARCATVFKTLDDMANHAQKNTIGLFTFPLRGSRLKVLQAKLDRCKVDLQLMMQIIIYARLKTNNP